MLLHNHMKSSSMNVGLVVLLYVQTRADGPIIIPLHDFSASWSSIQQRSHLHRLHGICYVFLCRFLCVTIFQSTEQPFALITRPLLWIIWHLLCFLLSRTQMKWWEILKCLKVASFMQSPPYFLLNCHTPVCVVNHTPHFYCLSPVSIADSTHTQKLQDFSM